MTYAEKMTMKLMGEMSYNYGNQPETLKIVNQIMADTKRTCVEAIENEDIDDYYVRDQCITIIEQAEPKGANNESCQKYHNTCEKCDKLFWCKDGFQTLCTDCAWKELEKCRAAIKYWESSAQRMAAEVERARAEIKHLKEQIRQLRKV